MSAELFDWVQAYLERDEEIVVPIKKMWNEWHAIHEEPLLTEFTAEVLGDERLEEMPGVSHTEGMEWMSPEELEKEVQEMEAIGFFSGPRVKLKSREITEEHIAKMIQKHNDRMEWNLQQARMALPDEGTGEERGAWVDVMGKVRQLRQHLREAGLEPDDAENADGTEFQQSTSDQE